MRRGSQRVSGWAPSSQRRSTDHRDQGGLGENTLGTIEQGLNGPGDVEFGGLPDHDVCLTMHTLVHVSMHDG